GNTGSYYSRQNRSDSRIEWRESYSLTPINDAGVHNLKFGTVLTFTTNDGEFFAQPVNIQDDSGKLFKRNDFCGGSPFNRKDLEGVVFAQDHWSLSSKFALDLGLRVERQSIANNFRIAPRFGFSWNPLESRSTVVRGGFGIFFDRVPLSVYSFGN